MSQAVLTIQNLPANAVEAAAQFHTNDLPKVQALLQGGLAAVAIVMPSAPRDHDDWRRAIARDLARAHAPQRINMTAGADADAVDSMLAYLRDAQGITGQYLPTHE